MERERRVSPAKIVQIGKIPPLLHPATFVLPFLGRKVVRNAPETCRKAPSRG